MNTGAAGGQPPGDLDDVDVHAPGIAGARLVQRAGVHGEGGHPPRHAGAEQAAQALAQEGISAEVDAKQTKIAVRGVDKHLLGLTAARIRALRPPEPYKGKGVKYSDEFIFRKEGKKK